MVRIAMGESLTLISPLWITTKARAMGKKKGKGGGGGEPTPRDADDKEEEVAGGGAEASADAAVPMPPPPAPPAPPSSGDAATPPAAPSSSAGDDDPTMREDLVVKGTSETRHIASVPYCEGALLSDAATLTAAIACHTPLIGCRSHRCCPAVCSLPFEFCEWGPNFKKCKESFGQNYQKHFPDVAGDEELLALMTRLGFEGGDEASKKAQKAKKSAGDGEAAAGGGGGGKKKEKAPPEIVIELNNRNKKKHITVVKGLDAFDVDTAAAAKTFGKKFACGSALKKAQDGQPESIEIQVRATVRVGQGLSQGLSQPVARDGTYACSYASQRACTCA